MLGFFTWFGLIQRTKCELVRLIEANKVFKELPNVEPTESFPFPPTIDERPFELVLFREDFRLLLHTGVPMQARTAEVE